VNQRTRAKRLWSCVHGLRDKSDVINRTVYVSRRDRADGDATFGELT